MGWGKVDDKLHSSVKWLRASRTARGLWVTALSWCSDQENGGLVPSDVLRRLDGTKADADSLIKAGLWEEVDGGYVFHDWDEHNPDAASAKATRSAKSEGGKFGNHERWHVKRRIKVDGCEFCESHIRSVSDRKSESGANPPDPTRPDPTRKETDRGDGPEFQNINALLVHYLLTESERPAFLAWVKRKPKVQNPAGLVNSWHNKGEMQDQIESFRLDASSDNLASMPKVRPKSIHPEWMANRS